MIKTQNLTPSIYYNRSRDFQFLGRIYDIVFNYVKTNSMMVKEAVLNENTDDRLIDLICLTLGFKQMHSYNIKQLRAICSIFMLAIRNKGSILSIQLAVYSILYAENISEEPDFEYDTGNEDNKYFKTLNIYIPASLSDITLLNDVLDYILPAGLCVNIIKKSNIKTSTNIDTYSGFSSDRSKSMQNISGRSISKIIGYVPDETIKQADLPEDNSSRWDTSVIPVYGKEESGN